MTLEWSFGIEVLGLTQKKVKLHLKNGIPEAMTELSNVAVCRILYIYTYVRR